LQAFCHHVCVCVGSRSNMLERSSSPLQWTSAVPCLIEQLVFLVRVFLVLVFLALVFLVLVVLVVCGCRCSQCRCSHTADRNVPLICAVSWFHGLYLCVCLCVCVCHCPWSRCSHTADRNVPLICAASWFHGLDSHS
jgi:hypothetical protein